jgi:hypothetical protein
MSDATGPVRQGHLAKNFNGTYSLTSFGAMTAAALEKSRRADHDR